MYSSYYHQNLGTAGHRATSSYNYLPQYTPSTYFNPHHLQHSHSRSMYSYPSGYNPYTAQAQVQVQAQAQAQAQVHAQMQMRQAQVPPAPVQPQPQEEVNGGINSVLEYDLNNMAHFLSWCAFGMLKQNKNPSKDFENLIVSVLFATRLPKSTIIIALEYMNQRFSNKSFDDLPESEIFTKLTIALVLANKFNDDNTFTNRSWCGATGLKIELINHEERTWLAECKWQLNVVNFESNIRTLEECWVAWLNKYGVSQGQLPSPADSHVSTSPTHPKYFSSPVLASPTNEYQFNPHQQPTSIPPQSMHHHQNSYPNCSIPSSPVYSAPSHPPVYSYASPLSSSPIKYSQDQLWSGDNSQSRYLTHQASNIWSYTPSYQYVPNPSCNDPVNMVAAPYAASANPGFVGYANPFYGYNIPTC